MGAEQLASWTGFRIPGAFFCAGLGLAAIAALLYSTLTQPKLNPSLALVVTILNAVCAVSGLVMLVMLWGLITERGRLLLGTLSALLGVIALVEYLALRNLTPDEAKEVSSFPAP